MNTRRERGRPKYRLTVKLDLEWDADLITWLEGIAPGSRSTLIRAAWRAGLREPAQQEPVDIEGMRRVMAEELSRVLAGQRLVSATADPPAEVSQAAMEAKFGSKLDQMMSGLMKSQSHPGEDDNTTKELPCLETRPPLQQ